MKITTEHYVTLNRNCAEAVAFYADLLGAEAQVMTFNDLPPEEGMPELPEATKKLVMHAQLVVNGQVLRMASDMVEEFCTAGTGYQPPQGMNVAVTVDTLAEGKRLFDALAEGGQVQMPFEPTFWAAGFGIVTDRFGTPVMLNAEMRGSMPV